MTQPSELRQRVTELLKEGRSDKRIAKALHLSREEVAAEIAALIEEANLDRDEQRIAALAERAGLVEHD